MTLAQMRELLVSLQAGLDQANMTAADRVARLRQAAMGGADEPGIRLLERFAVVAVLTQTLAENCAAMLTVLDALGR